MLLDLDLMKSILNVTVTILHENFFYDEECLMTFVDKLEDLTVNKYKLFAENLEQEYINELKYNSLTKMYFTSYFMSCNLQDVLVNNFYFSDTELNAFESILPKYTGANEDDFKPNSKRAHH